MDLARDLFRVSATKDRPTEGELLAAVEGAGFKATVQQLGEEVASASGAVEAQVMPALVEETLERAGREGKLLLIDFFADWCAPCKRMLNETFQDPDVVSELRHFVFLKLDTDAHPEVSKHFGVTGIPDVRILRADGTEVARFLGFKTASEVLKELHAARGADARSR
jgi:thiol:disulfide interchange protein